jgi:N-acetylglucosamine-6-phosphate deacetylase
VKSSIVADGIHVDFAAVRISIWYNEGAIVFYYRCSCSSGKMENYTHVFKGDRFTLPDGTLSGSALTMMKCVKNGVKHCGLPLERALEMASAIPCFIKQIGGIVLGQIRQGFDCELVILMMNSMYSKLFADYAVLLLPCWSVCSDNPMQPYPL